MKFPKLVHIASTKQLMICGGDDNDKMFICNVDERLDATNCEWISYKLKMPYQIKDERYGHLVALDDILFMFYFERSGYTDIYCLDILQSKWHKSNCSVP